MSGDREAYWLEHIRKWTASGQSVASYVVAHGLSRSCFYKWRQLLQGRQLVQAADPVPLFQPVAVIQDEAAACPVEQSPARVSPPLPEPVDPVVAQRGLRSCATLVLAPNSQHNSPPSPNAVTALVRLPNGVAVKLSGGLRLPDLETVLRHAAALP